MSVDAGPVVPANDGKLSAIKANNPTERNALPNKGFFHLFVPKFQEKLLVDLQNIPL